MDCPGPGLWPRPPRDSSLLLGHPHTPSSSLHKSLEAGPLLNHPLNPAAVSGPHSLEGRVTVSLGLSRWMMGARRPPVDSENIRSSHGLAGAEGFCEGQDLWEPSVTGSPGPRLAVEPEDCHLPGHWAVSGGSLGQSRPRTPGRAQAKAPTQKPLCRGTSFGEKRSRSGPVPTGSGR